MIGGIRIEYQHIAEPKIVPHGRPESDRVIRVCNLAKAHGYISLEELARKMRLGHDQTMNAIQSANIMEGSRIYEDVVQRRMFFGWLP